MLQILVWAGCVLIIGVGACASTLEKIAAGSAKENRTGLAIFIGMFLAAAGLFYLSIKQGEGIANLFK